LAYQQDEKISNGQFWCIITFLLPLSLKLLLKKDHLLLIALFAGIVKK